MLAQNQTTCWSALDTVTPEDGSFRLNQQSASAGFMLRHMGEVFMLYHNAYHVGQIGLTMARGH